MSQPVHRMTYDEYVALERASDTKHEFVNGELFAMSGAKRAHNEVTRNVLMHLGLQLRNRPCRPYGSDMRVRTRDGVGAYPDVSVACGKLQFSDAVEDELLNPTVIVEVLSDSTESYDRGEKFRHYRSMPSFCEYVLASSKEARVDHFQLREGVWTFTSYGAGETIRLPSVDCVLSVDEMYERAFDEVS